MKTVGKLFPENSTGSQTDPKKTTQEEKAKAEDEEEKAK